MSLAGRRILVVEDNFDVAYLIRTALEEHGAEIIGPAATVSGALALIAGTAQIDGATIDINLGGEMAYAVIDVLRAQTVPIVIITGYDAKSLRPDYADMPSVRKPFRVERVIDSLLGRTWNSE